ncbi:flagellar biosynthesis anti-sigma factor FlgM [Occallatibacter riparius]|uniref:Negative regulator of flagellin synthesis n=1 Tax=Occallatibacter riparius TaxID=1002689 RepID=A0A9J7BKG9_9BACT|nr:flagellar biosynthesis anti-sigma factor FlgM [Occallatibacter riparius]UWZ82937.1 flagellar biosynthesis anti-sigma factor FlgM [Occallatibacter riparius]
MDIRTGLDGLRSLLGVSQPGATSTPAAKSATTKENSPVSSDVATLSSAGSEVAQSAADGGVRMDKVTQIQAALAAGTYNVPASAVASRMVDAMLAGAR